MALLMVRTTYDFSAEEEIDHALAMRPELLNGSGSTKRSLRWLFVARRFPIRQSGSGSRRAWEADVVFVDENFVPTIVEAKLNDNSEIDRTVVGQMLDYLGSVLHENPVEDLRKAFIKTTEARNLDPDQELSAVFGALPPEAIWAQIARAFERKCIRLVLASDGIPVDTHRTLHHLNSLLDTIEIELLQLGRNEAGHISSELLGAPETGIKRATKKARGRKKEFTPIPLRAVPSSKIRTRRDYYAGEKRLSWVAPLPDTLFVSNEVTSSTKYAHQVDPGRTSSMSPVMPNFELLQRTGNPYPPLPDETVRPPGQVYAELVRIAHSTWNTLVERTEIEVSTRAAIVDDIVEKSGIELASLTIQVLRNHKRAVVDSLLDCANFGLLRASKRGRDTYRFKIGGPNWPVRG